MRRTNSFTGLILLVNPDIHKNSSTLSAWISEGLIFLDRIRRNEKCGT